MADKGYTWHGQVDPNQWVLNQVKDKPLYPKGGKKRAGLRAPKDEMLLALLRMMTQYGNPMAEMPQSKVPGPLPTPEQAPLQGQPGQRGREIEEQLKVLMEK